MKNNRSSLALLFLTMLIVNTGFGVIMPILPYYAQSLGADATVLGLLSATFATLQFFFAPLWGQLSDRFGRKPILLVGLGGFGIAMLVFGLSTQLWMLFLARSVSGILSSATLPTVMAFIADTTQPKDRAGGMGLMGAAGGIGMILGPVIGGFLGADSPHTPFFFSAGLALLVWFFALIFLPETFSREQRALAATARPAQPQGRLAGLMGALRGPLAFLMILAALTSFGMAQLESTGALFARQRFGAGAIEMGTAFMVMGVVGVFTQFVLVKRVIGRMGEERAIQWSLLGTAISLISFGLAENFATMIAVLVLLSLATAFTRPALNSLVSRSASRAEQGTAMGVINSFYSLGMVFGPVTGGLIFDHIGISWPFFSGGTIFLIAVAISWVVFRRQTA
jgi:DHA1 family multidrug resistance protein-like MFS transporter